MRKMMHNNVAKALILNAIMTSAANNMHDKNTVYNKVSKEWHAYDNVHLTKAQRKNKTYEEQQLLRKQIYEQRGMI